MGIFVVCFGIFIELMSLKMCCVLGIVEGVGIRVWNIFDKGLFF